MNIVTFFSQKQSLSGTGTIASTLDYTNTGAFGDAIPHALWLQADIAAKAASANNTATVQIKLQTAAEADTGFASAVDLYASPAFTVAQMNAALASATSLVQIRLPAGNLGLMRVVYVVGTEALTAGTFNAVFTDGISVVRPIK